MKKIALSITFTLAAVAMSAAILPSTEAQASIGSNQIADSFNSLPESEKLKIAQQIERAKDIAASTPISSKDVKEWAGVGSIIGKEIVSLVKEVNTPMKEFIHSPVGVIATSILIIKIMGDEFSTVLGSVVILFLMLPLWIYMYRRTCVIKKVTWVKTDRLSLFTKRPIYRKSIENYASNEVSDARVTMVIILGILMLSWLVITFS